MPATEPGAVAAGVGTVFVDAAADGVATGFRLRGSAPVTGVVLKGVIASFDDRAVNTGGPALDDAMGDVPGCGLDSSAAVDEASARCIGTRVGDFKERPAGNTCAVRSCRARDSRSDDRLGVRAAGGPRLRPPMVGRGGREEDGDATRARGPPRAGEAKLPPGSVGKAGRWGAMVTACDRRQRDTRASEGTGVGGQEEDGCTHDREEGDDGAVRAMQRTACRPRLQTRWQSLKSSAAAAHRHLRPRRGTFKRKKTSTPAAPIGTL